MKATILRGAVKPDNPLYISRTDTVNQILYWVDQNLSVLLTAPYMTGKTSILLEVCERARKSGKAVVFLDLSIYVQEEEEFPAMLRSIFEEIARGIPHAMEENDLAGEDYGYIDSGGSFGRALLKLASEHSLVIVLDEFQRLKENDMFIKCAYALRWVTERAKMPPYDNIAGLSFIISGVIDLNDLTDGHSSPFNTLEYMLLPDLSIEEVSNFLSRPGTLFPEGAKIPEDSSKIIFLETGGHPLLLQMLASDIRKMAEEGHRIGWGEEEIVSICERIADRFSFDFDIVLERLETRVAVQELVQRILNGENIRYSNWHVDVRHARLVGVVRPDEQGFCRIRGRIYERIIRSEGWDNIFQR